MKLTESQTEIIENYTDLYFSLRNIIRYLKPSKVLMNDEFRILIENAEKVLEQAKV